MAKFLQETIHETALEHKELEKSTKAEEFAAFFDRIRVSGDQASNEEIMKFAKLFEDDLTLDSLPREVIVALCRLLEIGIYGLPIELLRFQLRMRLRNLKSDDKVGTCFSWLASQYGTLN
jgi:LETM1 and EF-hand domain-containing protein 1, mitochondrial